MIDLLNEFDRISDAAGNRHAVLVGALKGEVRRAMVGSSAFSPARANALKSDLMSIGLTSVIEEENQVGLYIELITRSAQERAVAHLGSTTAQDTLIEPSEALRASETASESYLLNELVQQVNKNVNQLIRDYRNASLRALMKTSFSREKANTIVLNEELKADRDLFFIDSAGRRLSSSLHVRRTWRQVIRDHFIQIYLQTLSANGEKTAILWHPDIAHKSYGRELQFSLPDFGIENKNKVLHPNSRALPMARSFMESHA